MKEAYDKMSSKTKQFVDLCYESDATIMMLKATMMDKQSVINIHLDTITVLKQELATTKIEMERVNNKLISYTTSAYVLDHIFQNQTKENESEEKVIGNGKRLGYHRVPPPFRECYCQKKLKAGGGKGAKHQIKICSKPN
ncbi:hypothetical protein Hanom_Chr14g01265361 [Helianthus anomalus]